MLDNKLIESTLQLTGKNIFSMESCNGHDVEFSIEKFCYYLLSKPFLSEYEPYYGVQFKDSMKYRVGHAFQEAITSYQDGNDKLLVDLLEKLV